VKLDEVCFARRVHQTEGIHAESFHHSQRPRDRSIRHGPHDHVQGFWHEGNEIPKSIVGRGGLGIASIGFHLDGVNQIRELHGVLNKEDGNVVADQIEIALLCVKLDREPSDITRQIDGASASGHRGKARENWRFDFRVGEKGGLGDMLHGFVGLEVSMGGGPPGVDDPFGDTLMIKVRDFLAQDEVFKQCGTPSTCLERILIIAKGQSLIGSQQNVTKGFLMDFAAVGFRAVGAR